MNRLDAISRPRQRKEKLERISYRIAYVSFCVGTSHVALVEICAEYQQSPKRRKKRKKLQDVSKRSKVL